MYFCNVVANVMHWQSCMQVFQDIFFNSLKCLGVWFHLCLTIFDLFYTYGLVFCVFCNEWNQNIKEQNYDVLPHLEAINLADLYDLEFEEKSSWNSL